MIQAVTKRSGSQAVVLLIVLGMGFHGGSLTAVNGQNYEVGRDNIIRAIPSESLIAQIKNDIESFMNRNVEVTGSFGGRLASTGEEQYIWLIDAFNESILVRIKAGDRLPQRGEPGTFVAAVATYSGSPLLKKHLTPPPPPPPPPSGWDWDPVVVGLLAAAGVVLVIVVVLVTKILKQPEPVGMPQAGQQPALAGPVEDMSGTVKVAPPVDLRTRKMLPGYFQVLVGKLAGQQLHIYSPEATIGRSDGVSERSDIIGFPPEEKSVSREQAKLRYDATSGAFRIINLADPVAKNATMVNGRDLAIDESAELKDGDKIRIGEVEIEFHTMTTGG